MGNETWKETVYIDKNKTTALIAKTARYEWEPEMVFVEGGTYLMGRNDGKDDENPIHNVTISDFYMGKYEVTVAQFNVFIDGTGYSTDADKAGGSDIFTIQGLKRKSGVNWRCDAQGNFKLQSEYNNPVMHVSWNDANEYCKWLSKKTGKNYRLPTEAEWEYAAGNGSQHTKYSWGNNIPYGKQGGNVADESAMKKLGFSDGLQHYTDGFVYDAPIGSFNPNSFGLFDMTGNVWEWCSDWYNADYYNFSPQNNPRGPSSGIGIVLRGGGWNSIPRFFLVAYRDYADPDYRGSDTGFRLVQDY